MSSRFIGDKPQQKAPSSMATRKATPEAAPKTELTRRTPRQSRGREKVEIILSSAKTLIGEKGNDAVSIREIAAHAGIAPSSIYQYFPDKNAILKAIMQGYFERIQIMISHLVGAVDNIDMAGVSIAKGMGEFMALFRREPALATIWAGVQANTVLREMDAEDSAQNASTLAEAITKHAPHVSHKEAFDACLLLMHIASTTVRLALTMEKQQGDDLINELKLLTQLRIETLVSGSQSFSY